MKFGLWEVIDRNFELANTKPRWNCICRGCNTTHVLWGSSLRANSTKGCRKCRSAKQSNLVGKEFGNLIVINFAHFHKTKKEKRKVWICLCRKCNKQVEIKQSCLTAGKRTACWECCPPNGKTKPNIERIINFIYGRYRNSAKERGLPFLLERNFFDKMIQGNCYYCGTPPNTRKFSWSRGKSLCSIKLNGIDRVDNAVGYVKSNVVTACKNCNYAKKKLNFEQFVMLANKIAKAHPRI